MRKRLLTWAILGLLLVPCASQAALIVVPLDPAYTLNVSLDGDRDDVGTVNGGTLNDNLLIGRERLDQSQEALRIAAFIHFDLSGLSPDAVNAPTFQAVFKADFDERLNTINNMAIKVGRVDDDGVNGDTWDASEDPGTVPLFEWGLSSADEQTLVSNVRTSAFGTYSIDVTSIVQGWVNGTNANNGLVLYGDPAVFQGAGLNNPILEVTLPEPSTYLVFTGLIVCFGAAGWWRRRRTQAA